MRFEELLDHHECGELSQMEAAEMLGVSERTFRRWRSRHRDEGPEGLVDRRVGKPSPRRAPESEVERAHRLYEEMYGGFTMKHFHEKLVERHNYKLCYTVPRLALQATGHVAPAPRRGAHRRKRPRRALAGITDVEAANRFIAEVYLPSHNARFAVAAEQEDSAFLPVAPELWREILCRHETRQVGNDNTVKWRGRCLQIPPSTLRPHFVRAKVRLHEYPDGAVALFRGPHRLADFAADGSERHLREAA